MFIESGASLRRIEYRVFSSLAVTRPSCGPSDTNIDPFPYIRTTSMIPALSSFPGGSHHTWIENEWSSWSMALEAPPCDAAARVFSSFALVAMLEYTSSPATRERSTAGGAAIDSFVKLFAWSLSVNTESP